MERVAKRSRDRIGDLGHSIELAGRHQDPKPGVDDRPDCLGVPDRRSQLLGPAHVPLGLFVSPLLHAHIGQQVVEVLAADARNRARPHGGGLLIGFLPAALAEQ